MTKLTTAQQALLARTAEADGGAIVAEGDPKTIAALIKKGFLISIPQNDAPSRLVVTEAGREAGMPGGAREPDPATDTAADSFVDDPTTAEAPENTSDDAAIAIEQKAAGAAKPKGKLGSLVELLRQPDGATVEAMMAATGWQAHSVRGAMSGAIKKSLGLAVISEKTETGRIYRLENEEGA